MCRTIFVICLVVSCNWINWITADVSHLKSLSASKTAHDNHHHHFSVFNGYDYNPPTLPSPAPYPYPPSSTTFLPEIIVNKAEPSNTYLPPPLPQHPPTTETPIVIHPPEEEVYLPPFNEEIPPQPPIEPPQAYLPPENVPDNQYLPPQADEPIDSGGGDDGSYPQSFKPKQSKFLKHEPNFRTAKSNPLHISVNSLRCLDGHGGYFRANIGVQSFIENLPIIDLDSIDPRCQFNVIGVKLILQIAIEDFPRCGIVACSNRELCVNLRFPQVFGMKSFDDYLLTLKCKVQDRVVSKTHAFRFGVSQPTGHGRNSVVYANGGGQPHLRTQLGLYRLSGSGFTKSLESGGFVQLGEELMLRAQIKYGDGWNHSRVADVSLQRVGPNGEILNSATLIKPNGCVNPQMRSICTLPPVFEPPLGYRFGFRAVMFQGMKSGDEMIMNVRIIGCMDHHDCHLDHTHCASSNQANRRKRHSNIDSDPNTDKKANETHEPLVEISNISFRVMLPADFQKMQTHNRSFTHTNTAEFVLITTITLIGFLILIGLIVWKCQKQRPFSVWDKH